MILLIWLALVTPVVAAPRQRQAVRVPTRDGQHLAADVYVYDARPRPTIVIQTPYNKNLLAGRLTDADTASPLFASPAYHYLVVDWRGRFASRDAGRVGNLGRDGYDVIEWAARQPWCDGNLGTWGPSALGEVQLRTAELQPPHLRCGVPMVCKGSYTYEHFYPGGVLREEYVDTLDALGFGLKQLITSHPTKDLYWRAAARAERLGQIRVPLLHIGGWFDICLNETIAAFETIAARTPGQRLLLGPWVHSGIDQVRQGDLEFPLAEHEAARAALAFFDQHLRGVGQLPAEPVRWYHLGADEWRVADRWPAPNGESVWYPGPDGALGPRPADGRDTYRFNPADPTPTTGGQVLSPTVPTGPLDQGPRLAGRTDLLRYTSEPLTTPLAVHGAATVKLLVSVDRETIDIAVRLVDVHPDGRAYLLTDGIQRLGGPTRGGWLTPDGPPVAATIELPPLAVTFPVGHRLQLIVSSANHPRFAVNPTTRDGRQPAAPATVHVHREGSSLTLPTLTR